MAGGLARDTSQSRVIKLATRMAHTSRKNNMTISGESLEKKSNNFQTSKRLTTLELAGDGLLLTEKLNMTQIKYIVYFGTSVDYGEN